MAVKQRSGIAVGLNKGHVCILSSSFLQCWSSAASPRPFQGVLADQLARTENHPPPLVTHITYQRTLKQTHRFRSRDCKGGVWVCHLSRTARVQEQEEHWSYQLELDVTEFGDNEHWTLHFTAGFIYNGGLR